MLKRIICSLTVISVLFASTLTSYAVLPQNMGGSGVQQGPILVFHDDFTHGSGLWKITNMTMTNGKITSPDSTSSNIKFYDEAIELTDADYFIKFSPVKYNEGLAILAGDGLLNYAFETAVKAFDYDTDAKNVAKAMKVLAQKAGKYDIQRQVYHSGNGNKQEGSFGIAHATQHSGDHVIACGKHKTCTAND